MEEAEIPVDPLGARDTVVHVESLTRWNLTQLPLANEESDSDHQTELSETSPFPWNNELNNKIILW